MTIESKPKGVELNTSLVNETAGLKPVFNGVFVLGRTLYNYTAAVTDFQVSGSVTTGYITLWVTELRWPDDSQTITLTVHNYVTSDPAGRKADARFSLPVILPAADFMDSGTVAAPPILVPSLTTTEANNGGIYISWSKQTIVDGIVGWPLPDGTDLLVAYFARRNVFFEIKPVGTGLNEEVLQEVAKSAQKTVSGLVAVSRSELYTFTAT